MVVFLHGYPEGSIRKFRQGPIDHWLDSADSVHGAVAQQTASEKQT